MEELKWLEVSVNTTPDRLDSVCAKLAAAGMDSLEIGRASCRERE